MATRKFELVKDGKKRLEIVQPMFSGKRIIKIDGKQVGEIPNQKALKDGWELKGKGGANLTITSYPSFLNSSALDVRFNGKPVPKSDSNPNIRLSNASQVAYIVGAFNLLLGIFATLLPGNILGMNYTRYSGYTGIVTGIGYLVVGFFVQRRSKIALGFGMIAFILDTLLIIISVPYLFSAGAGTAASSGVGGMVGGLFVRFVFLAYMYKGFSAINELNADA